MFAPQIQQEETPNTIRRQAELMALQAVDALRSVAPDIAPVFEQGGVREIIVSQYEDILEGRGVRWEGAM